MFVFLDLQLNFQHLRRRLCLLLPLLWNPRPRHAACGQNVLIPFQRRDNLSPFRRNRADILSSADPEASPLPPLSADSLSGRHLMDAARPQAHHALNPPESEQEEAGAAVYLGDDIIRGEV